MKKRSITIVLSALLATLVVGGAGVGIASVIASSNKTATPEELDKLIKDTYKFNDTLEVPEIVIEGATKVSTILICPDGSAKRATTVKLDQPGSYKLRYAYEKDGETKFFEKNFEVKFGLYYFSGEGETSSSAKFTTFTEFGEGTDLAFPGGSLTIPFSNAAKYPNTGLLIELAKGEKFTFSEPVPVSKFDGSDFINLYSIPYVQTENDYNQIFVDLVDAEDPNTYVSFRCHKIVFSKGSYESISALNVAGQNQIYTGCEVKTTGNKWHRNDAWGALIDHTFQATTNDGSNGYPSYTGAQYPIPSSYGQISLGFNNETKQCYTNMGGGYSHKPFGENKMTEFSDLDSPVAYDDAWTGFSSDKVYVSIRLGEYTGTKGRVMVPNYLFEKDLSKEFLSDVSAPKLTVNTSYTPSTMPFAYVGKYYPVPTATAYDDLCGKINVKTKVDFNYTSGTPSDVKIEDGKFKVDRVGSYRIIYSATDAFGNETEAIYYVNTSENIEPLKITFDDKKDKIDLGDVYTYPIPKISGGSGEVNFKVLLSNGDEIFDITKDKSKIIDKYGEWKIKYIVNDFAGDELVYEYDLSVYVTNRSFIYDAIEFDPYLFNNVPTKLPLINAYNYLGGTRKVKPASVEIEYNGSKSIFTSGELFTPSVNNNKDNINITYFDGESRFDTISKTIIDIGNANRLKINNYFLGSEEKIFATESGLMFINKEEKTDFEWTFANKFLVNNTAVVLGNLFDGKNKSSNLKSFEFKYADALDSTKLITAKVTIGLENLVFEVSGLTYTIGYSFNKDKLGKISIEYFNGNIVYKEGTTSMNMPVYLYDDGNSFDGFSSSSVSVGVVAKSVEKDNGYYLYSIGGCPVSEYTVDDTITPYTYTSGSTFGSYSKGSLYTVNPCFGSDVLAPQTNTLLSVIAPDGSSVTSVDGIELKDVDANNEYTFRLDQLGIYQILIKCEEVNWHWSNTSLTMKNVDSVDIEAPVIEILSEVPTEVKVGTVVYVPKFNIKDDNADAKNIKVFCTVIMPNIREIEVDMNGGFKANLIGTYYLIITAKDQFNRLANVQFAINCVA